MTADQARGLLLNVANNGRIMMNGAPLSGAEIGTMQQAVLFLYDQAKERQESKEEKMKPKNENEGESV